MELLHAKLCVNVTAASEDILCVQKQEGMKSLFKECKTTLNILLSLLRKHECSLRELPNVIFQTLLNEGGPELSLEASNLLKTKYSEIPYMEYLHTKDLQGLVQTRFGCSTEVAKGFDVTPQLLPTRSPTFIFDSVHFAEKEKVVLLFDTCVMSLNGETVGGIYDVAIIAWDISSGLLIGIKSTDSRPNCLVAVRDGFLFTASTSTLELWNFEFSECIRRWTDLGNIHRVFPISEERVACVGDEVIILDTTSGDIVSTIKHFQGEVVACNSKCQLITIMPNGSIQLWDGEIVLWECIGSYITFGTIRPIFSPAEQFVVLAGKYRIGPSPFTRSSDLFILDAFSGRRLHILHISSWSLCDYRFVSDEVCVVSGGGGGPRIRLFNVNSGDLLSVMELERNVYGLAACPRKRLFAIVGVDSKHKSTVIHVKLPQDKDNRKSKRFLRRDQASAVTRGGCWLEFPDESGQRIKNPQARSCLLF